TEHYSLLKDFWCKAVQSHAKPFLKIANNLSELHNNLPKTFKYFLESYINFPKILYYLLKPINNFPKMTNNFLKMIIDFPKMLYYQ
ncbi:MAG: hypothetical protein WA584_12565, partial [Pyrinomonadaceae bacterium]